MDAHPATARDEAHDLVAGDGGAATGETHEHVVETLDVDADLRTRALETARPQDGGSGDLFFLVAGADVAGHLLHQRACGQVPLTDGDERGVEIGIPMGLDLLEQHFRAPHSLHGQGLASELLGQLVAPGFERIVAPLTTEPLLDLVARTWRLDERQPIARRAGRLELGHEDLARVTAAQTMIERYEPTIDLGAYALVSDLGVHRVGEVDGRRVDRQRDDAALGREDEHLFLFEVGLQTLHELTGVADLGLPVDDAVEPVDVLGRCVFLVRPVRGDSPLGALVHLPRADLDLDRLAAGTDDRRVQALVEVELRHRDVVLEPPQHRLPPAVDAAERGVAVLDRVDDHTHGDEVEDLVEVAVLLDHLLVDAPHVLAATSDLRIDVQLGQAAAHLGQRLGEVEIALGTARADEVIEFGE